MDVPQTDLPRLSVVIPAFNESANLPPLISEIEATLASRVPFQVIVVNDGSNDATVAVVSRLMDSRPWLRLENHERKRGQSAAVWTGVSAARASDIAVIDGDGQNDPADIPSLLVALQRPGVALVTGDRRLRRESWVRRMSSRIANCIRSSLLHDGVPDTGCGLKVFRRRDFLALPRFDHMHRFLPALVKLQGGAVDSVPVKHRPRRHGRSNYGIRNRLWVGVIDLLGVMWLARRRF